MNEIVVTVHALQFISLPGVKHRAVGPHCPSALGHVEKVTVTLLAFGILKGLISGLASSFAVIFSGKKVDRYVLDAVIGLGKQEIKGVLRCREMAIHAVHHYTGAIVGMS